MCVLRTNVTLNKRHECAVCYACIRVVRVRSAKFTRRQLVASTQLLPLQNQTGWESNLLIEHLSGTCGLFARTSASISIVKGVCFSTLLFARCFSATTCRCPWSWKTQTHSDQPRRKWLRQWELWITFRGCHIAMCHDSNCKHAIKVTPYIHVCRL